MATVITCDRCKKHGAKAWRFTHGEVYPGHLACVVQTVSYVYHTSPVLGGSVVERDLCPDCVAALDVLLRRFWDGVPT